MILFVLSLAISVLIGTFLISVLNHKDRARANNERSFQTRSPQAGSSENFLDIPLDEIEFIKSDHMQSRPHLRMLAYRIKRFRNRNPFYNNQEFIFPDLREVEEDKQDKV